MRVSFRIKIFLALMFTVGVLLGGALLALDAEYTWQVQDLTEKQASQGRRLFDKATDRIQERLRRAAAILGASPRVQSRLQDQGGGRGRQGSALRHAFSPARCGPADDHG